MRATPCFLERRGREVATVGAGDGGPEVQAVFVVDAVQAGHVHMLALFAVAIYVFGYEAEGVGILVSAGVMAGRERFGEDGFVALALWGFVGIGTSVVGAVSIFWACWRGEGRELSLGGFGRMS